MPKLEQFVYDILISPKKKQWVLWLTFFAFIGSIGMFPFHAVLAKMLPGKSTNTFSIYVDLPNGSSFDENQRVNQCVVSLLQKEKEIRNIEVFSGMGSPLDYAGLVKGSGFKMGEHLSEIVVNLSDLHERDERSYAMVHRLRPLIQKECEPLVERTSIKMVEQPAGPPTLAALVIELYGQDDHALRSLSKEIKSILEHTPDLVDVDILNDDIYTKYTLILDTQKVMRSNVAIDLLQSLVYLSFEGAALTHKNSDMSPAQVPIFVVLSDGSKKIETLSRAQLEAKLASVMIPSQAGTLIPLNTLVRIEEKQSTPTIMSKNLQKMVTIVAEADLVSQVYPLLEARSAIKEKLQERYEIRSSHLFDLELKNKRSAEVFQLVWDGEMKVTMDTFRDLGAAFIAALILIFLLMVVYYKS